MCLFNTLQHCEELNNPYMNLNEQNQRTDYLNMMSAHNYSNVIAPHEAECEHDNRWVRYTILKTVIIWALMLTISC